MRNELTAEEQEFLRELLDAELAYAEEWLGAARVEEIQTLIAKLGLQNEE